MKTTRRLLRALPALVIGHWSLAISSVGGAAPDDALRPIAFQNGVNQQALGAETAALAREIIALIDELQRNGFPLQSLSALTELAAQLQTLGGEEMSSIAQRLRRLGESAQADPRATATEAYLAQQAIESRLKTLARQISIQQLREETARRLEALITRQLAIQRETRAIASAPANDERRRLLESDQSGIGEDLSTFFQTGENLLTRLRETDTPAPAAAAAAPAQTFAERINAPLLNTLSAEAVGELTARRYPSAYARQEALVAELRKILQGILSSLPKEQRLANALQQVSALRQQAEANQQAATPPSADANQAAAEQAQNLANQIAPLSPQAAAALQQAQQALQNHPASSQPGQPQPPTPAANTPQPGQPATPPAQPGQPQPATPPAQPNQPQAGTPPPAPGQPQPGPQPPPAPSAAQALAAAEAALQSALAQAQAQAQSAAGQPAPGTPPAQPGRQQAGTTPPQPGQPQSPQTAQTNPAAPRPASDQPGGDTSQSGEGDSQGLIPGHGPDAAGPAQAVGALRREEREAFTALQGERYPAEYSAWVQQYWRNLAQDQ